MDYTKLIDWNKIEAREMRDETGKVIEGAHWVDRNDVVRQLMEANTPDEQLAERPKEEGKS